MMDGILLLDKPAGPTSNRVLNRVRRWAKTRKVGHTGTLDPLATGLLPALVGRATRLAPFLPSEPKEYEATLRFGITTSTGDADGEILTTDPAGAVPPERWAEMVAAHRGTIALPVPRFAAVKVGGRPLYKYARAGRAVDVPIRETTILALETDTAAWPDVVLNVTCGSGTYVRALAEALGRAAGCGAHVVRLRRLRIADWHVADALAPEALPEDGLPPRAWIALDSALRLPALRLEPEQARRVGDGRAPEQVIPPCTPLAAGERFVFVDRDGRLLAVARSREEWPASARPPDFEFERVVREN